MEATYEQIKEEVRKIEQEYPGYPEDEWDRIVWDLAEFRLRLKEVETRLSAIEE